ncbi:DUF805 domain-containing protein [Pectinatus cerevisiiphilus]|uniref:Uncharacterized membrane protein YhaH (DUF805 family) n=1 Tax=Pectinatus cerevisiiphilus TaxID=86956 RepID=A0A4R3KFH5_9FIRM|nr:DUF805 domain-containing protein [Pectinatus cerevisiiphilus]TCS81401.1 uncharacterized membrane protein YhaH (DUF805 family) [Pectinatus cerevisiiphilus]
MNNFCPQCGFPIKDTANFCPKCGAALNTSVQSQPSSSVPQNSPPVVDSSKTAPSMNTSSQLREMFFQISGRLNRQRYILRGLFIFAFSCLALVADNAILNFFIYIPASVLQIMLSIRRCHDINKSGWFMLWSLVPIANIIISFILLLKPGTSGPNRFGPDPLQQHTC